MISAVPDPVAVLREMRRVTKPGGAIVILNHFRSQNPAMRHIEDALSEAFIRGQIRPGVPLEIGVEDGCLWYWQEGRGGALSS